MVAEKSGEERKWWGRPPSAALECYARHVERRNVPAESNGRHQQVRYRPSLVRQRWHAHGKQERIMKVVYKRRSGGASGSQCSGGRKAMQ